MRVLLLGAEGLLGTSIQATAQHDPRVSELIACARSDVDITDQQQVRKVLREVRPDACVNTAALMPADLCDLKPEAAYAVNTLGARHVSQACSEVAATAVYVSTDFVFDGQGQRPCRPDDMPRPVQTYGITKLAGEHETRLGSPRHLVLRTSCLFGPPPISRTARKCFVDRVLERGYADDDLKIVDNVFTVPTYTRDLATTVFDLLHNGADSGVHHVVNGGRTSWFGLARAAFDLLGASVQLTAIQEQLYATAPRPLFTPLLTDFPSFVRQVRRPWQEALAEYLREHHGATR